MVLILLIHPLVEHALWFGKSSLTLLVTIEVMATSSNRSLHLEVVNTGKWKEPGKEHPSQLSNGAGIGLENVRQRLEQAFSGNYAFDIFERNGRVHAVVDIDNSRNDDGKATDSSNR